MKTIPYIIIVLVFFLLLHYAYNMLNVEQVKESAKQEPVSEMERLGYNPETDAFINDVMSREPLSVVADKFEGFAAYDLKYAECRLEVFHTSKASYQSERWEFYCTMNDGSKCMIQSSLGIPEHQCSPAVLNKIKEKCLTIKTK